jgi:hypothetical protein
MFQIQNVPIVIEPGVQAIEAEFAVTERRRKKRSFPVQLFRVAADETCIESLPFIPTVRLPHVFALAQNPNDSLVLVVYDTLGRIHTVFTRDETKKSWEKREIADEHAGKTVKQFSIRYFFGSEHSRDQFMTCVESIIAAIQHNETPPEKEVTLAFNLLSRARTGPVVLPMAVAKAGRKEMKI